MLGRIFSRNKIEASETDIVMTLTPHIVRRPELTEADLRSFQLGGEVSPLLFEIPGVTPVVPSQPTGAVAPPPRIEPIRPPPASPSPSPDR